MTDRFVEFWTDESGVAMPEYTLLLALVSVGLLLVLVLYRDAIGSVFDRLASALRAGVETTQGYDPSAADRVGPSY